MDSKAKQDALLEFVNCILNSLLTTSITILALSVGYIFYYILRGVYG